MSVLLFQFPTYDCIIHYTVCGRTQTFGQKDNGHADEGQNHQNDQQGDPDALPVPVRSDPTDVLQTQETHTNGV